MDAPRDVPERKAPVRFVADDIYDQYVWNPKTRQRQAWEQLGFLVMGGVNVGEQDEGGGRRSHGAGRSARSCGIGATELALAGAIERAEGPISEADAPLSAARADAR